MNKLPDNFYNKFDIEDKLRELDFTKCFDDEQIYYLYKFDEKAFFDYYFWIEITPINYWESFKISWDIMFWHTSGDYWEKFYLSTIMKKYPQNINQKIIDFIDKYPLIFDRYELNFDDLILMKKELKIIVKCLNTKRMNTYYVSSYILSKQSKSMNVNLLADSV